MEGYGEATAVDQILYSYFNISLNIATVATPTNIAISTFFVRIATNTVASAASVSARLLASTVGAMIATNTAPGICRSHAQDSNQCQGFT